MNSFFSLPILQKKKIFTNAYRHETQSPPIDSSARISRYWRDGAYKRHKLRSGFASPLYYRRLRPFLERCIRVLELRTTLKIKNTFIVATKNRGIHF